MATHWKPHRDHACEDGKRRTVYIKGENVPFVGWMAAPDTYFSCAAYVRVNGRRVAGFVTSGDDGQYFVPMDSSAHLLKTTPRITLTRIRLNRGGYDQFGAYWGAGAPLYQWSFDRPDVTIGSNVTGEVRATTRAAAMVKARADAARQFPHLFGEA